MYLDEVKLREPVLDDKDKHMVVKILMVFVVYFITVFLMAININAYIMGVLSQIQVMIALFLVINKNKNGYKLAVIMLTVTLLFTIYAVVGKHNYNAISGIIVDFCAIIICTVINSYKKKLFYKLMLEKQQKEKIVLLNDEMTAFEEELRQQNDELMEKNLKLTENEEQLNKLVYYDVLTGLPNRNMLIERLAFLCEMFRDEKTGFAVAFIDLDNFKKINDTLGHKKGDLLLKTIAQQMQELIHSNDLLGRLGGDEFALIIQQKMNEEAIFEYVESLRLYFQRPICLDDTEINITASFGVSIFPKDGITTYELLQYSDIAMYQAKKVGKNGIKVFHKSMNDGILRRAEIEKQLAQAMKNQEFFLAFQPQYCATSKNLRGYEALIRWNSPVFGTVSPMKFIPITEELGTIVQIGEWILRTACVTQLYLQEKSGRPMVMSVNISAVQFMDHNFFNMVKTIVSETGIEPHNLELEITESIFITSINKVVDELNNLKELGIQIALDDFGTGYSSLSYLQKLPIDLLKIDKSFIDMIDEPDSKKQIVGAIIALMHQLDVPVIAEGVETKHQLQYLREFDCDFVQGYLWGKPIDLEEAVKIANVEPGNDLEAIG